MARTTDSTIYHVVEGQVTIGNEIFTLSAKDIFVVPTVGTACGRHKIPFY